MKLTKTQRAHLDKLWSAYQSEVAALTEQHNAAESKVITAALAFRTAVEAATNDLDTNAYTEARDALVEELTALGEEFTGEWDDRSEKWQEGEGGQAAREWVDSFEQMAADLPECTVADAFDLSAVLEAEGANEMAVAGVTLIDGIDDIPEGLDIDDAPNA